MTLPHFAGDCTYDGSRLSDAEIESAPRFPGWAPSYADWPRDGSGGFDTDRAHNAYHVRVLAEAMRDAGGWVGPPPRAFACGLHLEDGNHRYRAACWLRDRTGFEVGVTPVATDTPCWRPECRGTTP